MGQKNATSFMHEKSKLEFNFSTLNYLAKTYPFKKKFRIGNKGPPPLFRDLGLDSIIPSL